MAKIDLDRVRVRIMKDHPFFGALLHTVTIEESTKIPTACINGDNKISLNADYYHQQTEAKQRGLVCHEMLHGVFLHWGRIMKYPMPEDKKLGNMAADYLINYMIIDSGMELPEGALYDKKYNPDKYTMEMLIEELRKDPKHKKAAEDMVKMDQLMQGLGKAGGDGSDIAAEGKQLSPAEEREKQLQARTDLASAVMIAKKRGTLPGSIERFVDEMLKPRQNWREELREWFNVKIKSEVTWNRPNRRMVYMGNYLPTKNSLGCGHIGVLIDVSGSIGQHELAVFQSELNNIFELCTPSKVTVLYFDTNTHGPFVFDEGEEVKLKAVGGGGTDFEVGIKWFTKNCQDMTGLIMMTDMYGDWPNEPPFPMCVLSTTEKLVAPYGKTVYANLKEEEE